MPGDYYEDFDIGDTATSPVARTISESDVYTQSGLGGSYNPLHTDREYMQQSEFGERLVQNTLLITVATGLNRRLEWSPEIIAAYGWDNVRFVEPVFIDDTVSLESEVVDKRPRDEDSGIVSFELSLFNQHDELVLIGEYLNLLRRRE